MKGSTRGGSAVTGGLGRELNWTREEIRSSSVKYRKLGEEARESPTGAQAHVPGEAHANVSV